MNMNMMSTPSKHDTFHIIFPSISGEKKSRAPYDSPSNNDHVHPYWVSGTQYFTCSPYDKNPNRNIRNNPVGNFDKEGIHTPVKNQFNNDIVYSRDMNSAEGITGSASAFSSNLFKPHNPNPLIRKNLFGEEFERIEVHNPNKVNNLYNVNAYSGKSNK